MRTAMRRSQAGLTLVELMVALAIGAFLMIGAVTVFVQSRSTMRVTEAVARMQENARFAFDVLEPDIRLMSYWGLTSRVRNVEGRARATEAAGIGPAGCGNNWTIDLQGVPGTNNGYTWTCAGFAPVEANADTLVVRRVSEDPVAALTAGTLYVQSRRGGIPVAQLFVGPTIPSAFDAATSVTHRLVVNGYYVSRASSLGANVPSLRVWALEGGGVLREREILPGVEDMQVQLGVDTDLPETGDRGTIDRWVNANDPILDHTNAAYMPDAEILAVRVWLRIRAERPEVGYRDAVAYNYAGQAFGPFNDAFRRIVVSKTIYLRNARPPA